MTEPSVGYNSGVTRTVATDPSNPTRTAELDNLFKVPIFIDVAHHEIHEGDSFSLFISDLGAADTEQVQLYFVTPNTSELIHIVVSTYGSGSHVLTITEGITYSAGGTAGTARNRNRNSANTSACTLKTGSDGGADLITYTGGTVIWSETSGAGRLQAGSTRGIQEWILKSNTAYIIETTNSAGSPAVLDMNAVWYEHTSE